MNFKNVNWLAILLSLVACMGIGFLWYGGLFMDQWMAANGITLGEGGETMIKNGVEMPPSATPMIVNTIAMIIYALFMHWLLERSNSFTLKGGSTTGLTLGVILYIGIVLNNMFAMTPYDLTMIDGSYAVVLWTVIGTIIGAWPKKNKA
ncbi:MAG: DUF1761 domain-containing protein [Crocinitomicaceae bacterium]